MNASITGTGPPRSYLYAPGHSAKLVEKVFGCGADAVILDLEDAVPDADKDAARDRVAEALGHRRAMVRINAVHSKHAERDLEALHGLAGDIKIPKVESAADVAWVLERAPRARLHPILESAAGILAAREIAEAPGVVGLSMGLMDLSRDLRSGNNWAAMSLARSTVVMASAAARVDAPVDSAFGDIGDLAALREEAAAARNLGFFGKVAIHPSQVGVINEVYGPDGRLVEWAERVLEAFELSSGQATRTPEGEFVDLPVVERARQILGAAACPDGPRN